MEALLFRRFWAHSFSSLGGVVSIPSPLDVTGCLLWLRADVGVTRADNKVSSWLDSALGSNASQSSDTLKPLYVIDQINRLPVIRFDGSNDYMLGAIDIAAESCHAFMVAQRVSHINQDPGLTLVKTGGSDTQATGSLVFYQSSPGVILTYHNGFKSQYLADPGDDVPYIIESKFSGTTNTMYFNGAGQTPVADVNVFDTDKYYLGCRITSGNVPTPGGAGYANIDIAEILVYDSALSDGDRAIVEIYLNSKYKVY